MLKNNFKDKEKDKLLIHIGLDNGLYVESVIMMRNCGLKEKLRSIITKYSGFALHKESVWQNLPTLFRTMGQLVSGYLDFAERQAEWEQVMTMSDWAEHLERILTMSGEQLLQGNGSVIYLEIGFYLKRL